MGVNNTRENMAKSFKVDIFKTLTAIDRNNRDYYNNLSDEEKKGIALVVAMRWASAVESDEKQYPLIANMVANIGFHDLYKHPELQWLCLSLIGDGKPRRHKWIKSSKKTNIKSPKLYDLLRKKYPLASIGELEMMNEILTIDDIKSVAEDYGYQDQDIKDLVKEIKANEKQRK